MRVLVTGASGMLGGAIVEAWRERHEVSATGGAGFPPPAAWSYRPFDLATDPAPLVDWAKPDAIVHCAAITAVDACEAAPERTLDINGRSVERLLRAAPRARMLFISSDAVLGHRRAPARETATPAPLNVYGRSKLLGETLLAETGRGVAVRTTVVGWNRDRSKQSFVEWLVRSVENKRPISLFSDALFDPIAAAALAAELETLLAAQFTGVLHVSGRESVSKYDFGRRLCERLGLDPAPIGAGFLADVKHAAPRSADQRLDVALYEQTFGRRLPTISETIEALAQGYTEWRA